MAAGFYNEREVEELSTLSRTTIWRMVRAGLFPKPVPLSPNRKGWPRDVIDQWAEERSKGNKPVAA